MKFPTEQGVTTAVRWILFIFVISVPLIIIPFGFDAFRFPKVLLLRATAILLTGLLGVLWAVRDRARLVIRAPNINGLLVVAVLIVTWSFISALMADNPKSSANAAVDLLSAMVLFSAAGIVGAGRSSYLQWFLVPAWFTLGIQILQHLDVWHPLVGANIEALRGSPNFDQLDLIILREAALLGNRNDLGLYLLLPLSVALALTISGDRRIRRRAYFTSFAVSAGVILTATITSLVVGSILWFMWVVGLKRRRTTVVVAGVVAILAISASVVSFSESVAGRLSWYATQASSRNWEAMTGGRFGVYASALAIVRDYPVFGVGPGQFPGRYLSTATSLRLNRPDLFPRTDLMYWDMVHNDYLETAAEIGLIGLALCMGFVVLYLRRVTDGLMTASSPQHITRIASIGSVGAVGLCAMYLFPFQLAAIYGTLAVLTGFGLSDAENT